MKLRHWSAASTAAVAALALSGLAAPAQAAPTVSEPDPAARAGSRPDNLPHPLGDAQAKLRKEAVDKLVKGEASTEVRGGKRVIKLKKNEQEDKDNKEGASKDKYVLYDVNREESIFTVLTDFGTKTTPATGGTPGPAHNEIAEPDRVWDGSPTDDNTTYWTKDFNRAHYQDLMFGPGESFKDFYLKQSNGRFLAKGDVSDWVKVPYNEARYGSNKISPANGYWNYVKDTATAWYDAQKAAGRTDAQIRAYLQQFDKVDRYDYDGDGNFNEPDGYIDHFQAIHAGEGEEAGGGAQGPDAIWSHRWYAFSDGIGRSGPSFNLAGGVPLGNSGIWIGDYTTEPENGGLGVFAHEFGHDLGLPDLYDTSGGDNGTGFWTLMSAGSWLNRGGADIGTSPGYLGAWEKLQLGWSDTRVVKYGDDQEVKLGPADRDGLRTPQAIAVNLPDKTLVTSYNKPYSGAWEWWGGSADNLNTKLTRTVDLTTATTSANLTAWLWNDIELDYDYLYGEVSTDGGVTWKDAAPPITGKSDWTQRTWDLTAYKGKTVQFRFRYNTDGGVHEAGAFLDDIAVNVDGARVFFDDVEAGANGWTAAGFTRMGGSTSRQVQRYYLAENRVYSGYDANLRTGPYNFGWPKSRPDWVERFPYQNGLLVWYVNGEFEDNNTRLHPGGGQVLPVDARPTPIRFPDGSLLGNRRQPFDATFGQERTDEVVFHKEGQKVVVPSSRGIRTFDDSNPDAYWSSANPWSSTKVAGTGTRITVQGQSGQGGDALDIAVRFRE